MVNDNVKTLLIASFVPIITLEWFYKYLEEKFKIKRNEVFVYEIDKEEFEYLLTFKIKKDKKIDLKFHFDNATIVNIKNGCIFSINGLNRLIEFETNCETGNVNYENHKIDWKKYENKLILSNKNKLIIKNVKKLSDKQIKK